MLIRRSKIHLFGWIKIYNFCNKKMILDRLLHEITAVGWASSSLSDPLWTLNVFTVIVNKVKRLGVQTFKPGALIISFFREKKWPPHPMSSTSPDRNQKQRGKCRESSRNNQNEVKNRKTSIDLRESWVFLNSSYRLFFSRAAFLLVGVKIIEWRKSLNFFLCVSLTFSQLSISYSWREKCE